MGEVGPQPYNDLSGLVCPPSENPPIEAKRLSPELTNRDRRYRGVEANPNRHGRPRWYFRRNKATRIRLPDTYGSPLFEAAWRARWWLPPARPLAEAKSPKPSTLRGGVAAKRGVDPNTVQPLIGVYLLMLKDKVVYIGESLQMPARVAAHRTNGRPFDKVFYIATKANERVELEATLIKAFAPTKNPRGLHPLGQGGRRR